MMRFYRCEFRMNHPPRISIVTPSLNQGSFIRTAIQSIFDQQYPDLEYLVMDGGSTDESCAIAREFIPRLALVMEKDEGQSDAIDKGFSRVSGEIIGWLNADDYYAPGTLDKIAAVFTAHPDVGLVYGNAEYVNEAGDSLGPAVQVEPFNLDRLLSVCDFIVQPAAFFRRDAFEAVGRIRKELVWTMDYDLWIRLGKQYRVLRIPELLAFVRCHASTKTTTGGRRRLAEVERMIQSHGGRGLPAFFRLEAAASELREAIQFARRLRFLKALGSAGMACGRLASPRTMAVLTSPHTWRVIRARHRRDVRLAPGI